MTDQQQIVCLDLLLFVMQLVCLSYYSASYLLYQKYNRSRRVTIDKKFLPKNSFYCHKRLSNKPRLTEEIF